MLGNGYKKTLLAGREGYLLRRPCQFRHTAAKPTPTNRG